MGTRSCVGGFVDLPVDVERSGQADRPKGDSPLVVPRRQRGRERCRRTAERGQRRIAVDLRPQVSRSRSECERRARQHQSERHKKGRRGLLSLCALCASAPLRPLRPLRTSATSASSSSEVELRPELHIPPLQNVERLQPGRRAFGPSSVRRVDPGRRLAGLRVGANRRVRVERVVDVQSSPADGFAPASRKVLANRRSTWVRRPVNSVPGAMRLNALGSWRCRRRNARPSVVCER